jgi:hypothetical protein
MTAKSFEASTKAFQDLAQGVQNIYGLTVQTDNCLTQAFRYRQSGNYDCRYFWSMMIFSLFSYNLSISLGYEDNILSLLIPGVSRSASGELVSRSRVGL